LIEIKAALRLAGQRFYQEGTPMEMHWFVWFVVGAMGAFAAVLALATALTAGK
jgi:hypothetical protein